MVRTSGLSEKVRKGHQTHPLEVLNRVVERVEGSENTGSTDTDVHRVGARVLDDELHHLVDLHVVSDRGRDVPGASR